MFPVALISSLIPVLGQVLDRVIPDTAEAQKAKDAVASEILKATLEANATQGEITKIEAASPSVFVSGWRPFIGWTCGLGAFYSFLLLPLFAWASAIWDLPGPPSVDAEALLALVFSLLGLGGLRTYEKSRGVTAPARVPAPPTRK